MRFGVVFFLLLAGCPSKEERSANSQGKGLQDLIARGKVIYATNCSACHNPDAKKPGSLGPEIYGATRDLIEARVLRGDYPSGYTPKRTTKVMPSLPHLKNDIDALAAFLNN